MTLGSEENSQDINDKQVATTTAERTTHVLLLNENNAQKKIKKVADTSYASFNFPRISSTFGRVFPVEDREYTIILGISPTQIYHKDNHLKTTFELLKKVFPKLRVILFIGDWVQKYLLAKKNSDLDKKTLQEKAEEIGDVWLNYATNNGFIEIVDDEISNLSSSLQFHGLKIRKTDLLKGSDFYRSELTERYQKAIEYVKALYHNKTLGVKNIIHGFAGRRIEQENIDDTDIARVKNLYIDYNLDEMAGEKVIVELFPEADYIFYPDNMRPPLAELYKILREQEKFTDDKHLWVKIAFLSERRAQKEYEKLMKQINGTETPKIQRSAIQQNSDGSLIKASKEKNIRSEIMPTTSTQTLFGQKPNSEEKISKTTEVTVEFGTETNGYELSTKQQKKSVSEDESINDDASDTIPVRKDVLQKIFSIMTSQVMADPNKLNLTLNFMVSLYEPPSRELASSNKLNKTPEIQAIKSENNESNSQGNFSKSNYSFGS